MKLDAQGVVIADEGLRPQHGSGNKCGTTVDGEGELGFGCDWMAPSALSMSPRLPETPLGPSISRTQTSHGRWARGTFPMRGAAVAHMHHAE